MGMTFQKYKRHAVLIKYDNDGINEECVYIPASVDGPHGSLPVTEIGTAAFRDNYHLKCVVLPMSIQTISQSAFENCWSLQSVGVGEPTVHKMPTHSVFPPSLRLLEDCAFKHTKLMDITFTGDVSIGSYCFFECQKLKGVVFYRCTATFESSAFAHSGIQFLKMPDGELERLPAECFSQCLNLDHIELKNLDSIEYRCFAGCKNLVKISLFERKTPVHIEVGAFEGCKKLQDGQFYRTTYDTFVAMGDDLFYEVTRKLEEKYEDLSLVDTIIIVHKVRELLEDLSKVPYTAFQDTILISYMGTKYQDNQSWDYFDRFALFSKDDILYQFQPNKEWNHVHIYDLSPFDVVRLSMYHSTPAYLTWNWNEKECIFCSCVVGSPFQFNPRDIAVELLSRYLEFSLMETIPADEEMHIHSQYSFGGYFNRTNIGMESDKIHWLKYDQLSNKIGLYTEIRKAYQKLKEE